LADIFDMLTLHPAARGKVVRLLAELDAMEGCWIGRIKIWNGGFRGLTTR